MPERHRAQSPRKRAHDATSKAERYPASSARFVFRGVEYWLVGRDTSSSQAKAALTPAEAQIFQLLRAGASYEEIADKRGCSRHTVAKQITSLLRKLETTSRRELELLR
ncbi:MAG TPA: helix-turn-helix transcriptional regulator [Polyangiaceae bacterium]|nr:helix-turn-helix transcriptional regulator [Polyangiaceae bacterium]